MLVYTFWVHFEGLYREDIQYERRKNILTIITTGEDQNTEISTFLNFH